MKLSNLEIFFTQLRIMLLSFGGGPASLQMYEDYLVKQKKIITIHEFNAAVVQSNVIPGPMFIILAVIFGRKMKGKMGIFLMILPGIIMTFAVTAIVYWLLNNQETSSDIINKIVLFAFPMLLASNIIYIMRGIIRKKADYLYISLFSLTTIILLFKKSDILTLIIMLLIFAIVRTKLSGKVAK